MVRLAKFLAHAGVASRRGAEEIVRARRVTVAGRIVTDPALDVDADSVKSFLEGRVAKWWVPERVELIDEVPKTSVGKFDKKVLRARYADGDLDVVRTRD